MGKGEEGHIIAYRISGKIVCEDCVKAEEIISLLGNEQDIVMSSTKEKSVYFCERCKKQISTR